ncbi:glycosyl hydrolase family 18 protein [Frondihabitans sp. VKM Ac-2883]|uniref:glycosyl hydrolase family 18 protein n=1 Tax=Frondihabitans sp. VKM Ac-2883 TaxID=2783823 RepID=UPI00351C9258
MNVSRNSRLFVLMAVTAVFGLVVSGCTATPASAAPTMQVVGYAEAGSTPTSRLDASKTALSTVGVDGINVERGGASLSAVSPEALALLKAAHARHEKAELLVGNFDGDLGDFSSAIGDALLGSPSNIDSVVALLAAEVQKYGWDGVTIDLESLSSKYPTELTSLVSKLNSALGAGKSVSICLMATTGRYADLGYDVRGLGRAADHVVLMAYDQHGPTWTKGGPVGGLPWVKKTMAPLVRTVPATRIQLGIAGYGYTWPAKGDGTQVSDGAARALVKRAKAKAIWSTTQREWHATLSNGTVVWWSDAKSYRARLAYAKQLRIGGVAVWSLGLSDPLTR